jgi:hypothetical protein
MTPRNPNIYWFLLPLTAAISLVYAASRHEPWPKIWRHAARLAVMILVVMVVATVLLLLLNGWMEWPHSGGGAAAP